MDGHVEPAKEHTPLLAWQRQQSRASAASNIVSEESNAEITPDTPCSMSSLYLFLLCLGLGGLQMAWATELSNGSPYLLSLGMSKSWLAIVWVAGPLSGVIVQPVIGRLSDKCKVAWGRRRPFILAGTASTVVSLLCLAWTSEITCAIMKAFGAKPTNEYVAKAALGFAIAWIFVLDFSINTVQASIRAFIVDTAPTHQQDHANAWASRIVGFGNILGYLSGFLNLPMLFPFLGNTQFKVLCAFSCIFLVATVSISCYYVPEADPKVRWPPSVGTGYRGVSSFIKSWFTSFSRLTAQTQRICMAQFFNWMGWFPFLFYITTYIGQLHLNPLFVDNPHLGRDEINKAWEEATRFATFALLMFAVISFLANSLLPLFVQPIYDQRGIMRTSRFNLYVPHLTIRRAWLISHILFAVCMFSTFFITTAAAAAAMTGTVGLCWAMTLWAPFALISADISKRDSLKRLRRSTQDPISAAHGTSAGTSALEATNLAAEYALATDSEESTEDQAGVVLGLHNVAICAPQIIATLVSSIIFRLAQRERGVAGDDSVGWVLRFGGLAALAAAWRTSRIQEGFTGIGRKLREEARIAGPTPAREL